MVAERTYFVPVLPRLRLQIVFSLFPIPSRPLHRLYLSLLFLPPIQGNFKFLKHQVIRMPVVKYLELDNNLRLGFLLTVACLPTQVLLSR